METYPSGKRFLFPGDLGNSELSRFRCLVGQDLRVARPAAYRNSGPTSCSLKCEIQILDDHKPWPIRSGSGVLPHPVSWNINLRMEMAARGWIAEEFLQIPTKHIIGTDVGA
jgi:hypothetical protein